MTAKNVIPIIWANGSSEHKTEALTMDELSRMNGIPVWVVNCEEKITEGFRDEWALVDTERKSARSLEAKYLFRNYGTAWLAYPRTMRNC